MANRVCAVLGAGPGLGRSLAVRFASEGYKVALMSRKNESVKTAEQAITALGGTSLFVSADASSKDSLFKAFAEVKEKLGAPEVLIYNVSSNSFSFAKGILGTTPEQFEEVWRIETQGALLATQAVLPDMIAAQSGTILYTSATSAFRGSPWNPAFSMSKFGVRALSQSVAKEFGSKGIHACNMRLDCVLDTPSLREKLGAKFDEKKFANTDAVAGIYWDVAKQTKAAWTNEIDVRPFTEEWTY